MGCVVESEWPKWFPRSLFALSSVLPLPLFQIQPELAPRGANRRTVPVLKALRCLLHPARVLKLPPRTPLLPVPSHFPSLIPLLSLHFLGLMRTLFHLIVQMTTIHHSPMKMGFLMSLVDSMIWRVDLMMSPTRMVNPFP